MSRTESDVQEVVISRTESDVLNPVISRTESDTCTYCNSESTKAINGFILKDGVTILRSYEVCDSCYVSERGRIPEQIIERNDNEEERPNI